MAPCSTWLSLKDLSCINGIPFGQCCKELQKQGWSDPLGKPTQSALEAGIAFFDEEAEKHSYEAIWNNELCKQLLEKVFTKSKQRNLKIFK